jgi:hypothetical protein
MEHGMDPIAKIKELKRYRIYLSSSLLFVLSLLSHVLVAGTSRTVLSRRPVAHIVNDGGAPADVGDNQQRSQLGSASMFRGCAKDAGGADGRWHNGYIPTILRLRGGADNTRYYDILKLPHGEEDENAIKKAYKKAALKWHPDRNQKENKVILFYSI